MTYETIIIGGEPIGGVLAREFDQGDEILLLNPDQSIVERARNRGLSARTVPFDRSAALARAIPEQVETAIVATHEDGRNLLIAQHARVHGKPDRVIALVNDPRNVGAFDDARVTPVCACSTLAAVLRARVGDGDADGNEGAALDRAPACDGRDRDGGSA